MARRRRRPACATQLGVETRRVRPRHRPVDRARRRAHDRRSPTVKADPEAQRRLLDLQAIDTALAQLAHRRRTLPELAEIGRARPGSCRRSRTSGSAPRSPSTTWTATSPGSRRTSSRSGPARTATRPGSTPAPARPRELEALQHELASLNRRQSELEDAELELMEQRETAQGDARRRATAGSPRPGEQRAATEARRDEALAEIAKERGVQDRPPGRRSPPTCRPTWSRCTTRSASDDRAGRRAAAGRPVRRLPARAVRRRPGPGQGGRAGRGGPLRGVPADHGAHRGVRPVTGRRGSSSRPTAARGATPGRPATARWCATRPPARCSPSGPRRSAPPPTTSPSTAA